MTENLTPFERQRVASQILTYLGSYPRCLKNGGVTLADLSLDLGKCLTWIHHYLEPANQSLCAEDENPTSVYALGKSLQEIGLRLMERDKLQTKEARERTMMGRLDQLETELRRLQAEQASKTGGGQ